MSKTVFESHSRVIDCDYANTVRLRENQLDGRGTMSFFELSDLDLYLISLLIFLFFPFDLLILITFIGARLYF